MSYLTPQPLLYREKPNTPQVLMTEKVASVVTMLFDGFSRRFSPQPIPINLSEKNIPLEFLKAKYQDILDLICFDHPGSPTERSILFEEAYIVKKRMINDVIYQKMSYDQVPEDLYKNAYLTFMNFIKVIHDDEENLTQYQDEARKNSSFRRKLEVYKDLRMIEKTIYNEEQENIPWHIAENRINYMTYEELQDRYNFFMEQAKNRIKVEDMNEEEYDRYYESLSFDESFELDVQDEEQRILSERIAKQRLAGKNNWFELRKEVYQSMRNQELIPLDNIEKMVQNSMHKIILEKFNLYSIFETENWHTLPIDVLLQSIDRIDRALKTDEGHVIHIEEEMILNDLKDEIISVIAQKKVDTMTVDDMSLFLEEIQNEMFYPNSSEIENAIKTQMFKKIVSLFAHQRLYK